ncbi:hypothetical protein CCH79_00016544, partial [Gambusia affinis]
DSVPTQPGPASSPTPVTPVTPLSAAGRYDQNQNQSRSLDRSAEQQLEPRSGAQRGGGADCGARANRTARREVNSEPILDLIRGAAAGPDVLLWSDRAAA